MGLMFATRHPSLQETKIIRALLSTFRDGSGNQREQDGSTRANWREIERCISEAVLGPAGENKQIFDVVAPDDTNPFRFYGLSIKSKELRRRNFAALPDGGRVYMEIANSPAKFWADIGTTYGHTYEHFSAQLHPEEIGDSVLASVRNWHLQGKNLFERANPGRILDLENSCYLCVSYSDEINPSERVYQIHAFSLEFPENILWEYRSDRCLRGYDPEFPEETLFDWYAASGGQLKYYPRATEAKFYSQPFTLLTPPRMSLTDKARAYFPEEF